MAKTKFSRFDAADYLRTEEDIAEFLNAAIEESDGDYSTIRRAIKTAIRAKTDAERQFSIDYVNRLRGQ